MTTGHNTHASVAHTYKIESPRRKSPVRYMDITGNKATAYGFHRCGRESRLEAAFLGFVSHYSGYGRAARTVQTQKSLGVMTVQCEDEISGCASSIGASFAGALAVTSTSGPGVSV